jgi:hypothetical protein
MSYLFTVEYQIKDGQLIIKSIFKRKVYFIKDFSWASQEGSYHFLHKFNFGINAIVINQKNGKQIGIFGLKDHFDFYQKLQASMAQPQFSPDR